MHVSARINNMGKKRFSVKSVMKIILENTFGMNQQNMSFLIFLAIQTQTHVFVVQNSYTRICYHPSTEGKSPAACWCGTGLTHLETRSIWLDFNRQGMWTHKFCFGTLTESRTRRKLGLRGSLAHGKRIILSLIHKDEMSDHDPCISIMLIPVQP